MTYSNNNLLMKLSLVLNSKSLENRYFIEFLLESAVLSIVSGTISVDSFVERKNDQIYVDWVYSFQANLSKCDFI